MRANLVVFIVALCVCIIPQSDRAFAQKLYPVQGPLASQTPQPVLSGQIRRPMFSAGSVFMLLKSWTLPNGEILAGKPKKVKAASVNVPAPDSANPPQPNLAFA